MVLKTLRPLIAHEQVVPALWNTLPCPIFPDPKVNPVVIREPVVVEVRGIVEFMLFQKKKKEKKLDPPGSCLVACQSSFGTAAFMKNGRRHRMGSEDKLTVSGPSTYIHSITEAVHAHWINLPRLYLSSLFQTFPNATREKYIMHSDVHTLSTFCAFFRLPLGLCTSARHIKVTGFEPMAICTQNRCADQTALHLVSPPRSIIDPPDRFRLKPNSPGHREARTSWPLFLFLNLPPALYGFFEIRSAHIFFGWLVHLNFQIRRAPGLWTLRPLRSGFEPLTQGFSVLCSNQLSYLNDFPKIFFLQRIAPYLTTWRLREKPLTILNRIVRPFSFLRQALSTAA